MPPFYKLYDLKSIPLYSYLIRIKCFFILNLRKNPIKIGLYLKNYLVMAKKIKILGTPDLGQPFSAKLLGEAVKARRTQSGVRLQDAAHLCGVAKQTFMKIEHGDGNSKIESILSICKGLGIKLKIESWEVNEDDGWH